MSRIRTIKPEFFTSEDIVALTPLTRLLYVALWCEADRQGRMVWKPKTFKMRYFPADEADIDGMCKELTDAGLVRLYGDGLAYIPTFSDHQHINPRESPSKLPPPVIDASSTRADASVTHREEGKGREGKALVPNGTCPPAADEPGDCGDASSSEPGYEVPDCPHVEVIALYHEVLPMLPRVEVLNDARRGMLRQRWREVCTEAKFVRAEALSWWSDYFAFVAKSKFLTGQAKPKPGDPPFLADFEWLIRPQNFAKVIEKRYHRSAA